jgi:riboflavin biosynthesis pyrimidine reductase
MNTTEWTKEQIAAVDAVLVGVETAVEDVRGQLEEMANPTPRPVVPA